MKKIKIQLLLTAVTFLCLGLSVASAASFDCKKAVTNVEKMICSNSELLELDNQINIDYQKALKKTNERQQIILIRHQNHWLEFTRNRCDDELCLRHAYWSRIAELRSAPVIKKSAYKKETEKTQPIKQILASSNLYEASNQPLFCRQVFEDLKQMKDVDFIEPKIKTTSYEDKSLDPWKQHCKSEQPFNFGYECDPKALPDSKIINPKAELDGSCYVIYGEQPFKIFEIPTSQSEDKKRYILYMGSAFGPMNIKYRGEIRGGDVAGFHELDVDHCQTSKHWNAPIAEPSDYTSIIKHKNDYYFLILEPSSTGDNYFVSIGSIDNEDKFCRWYPQHTTITNTGKK